MRLPCLKMRAKFSNILLQSTHDPITLQQASNFRIQDVLLPKGLPMLDIVRGFIAGGVFVLFLLIPYLFHLYNSPQARHDLRHCYPAQRYRIERKIYRFYTSRQGENLRFCFPDQRGRVERWLREQREYRRWPGSLFRPRRQPTASESC